MLGVSYVMTFYVDACALVYFQFHPRSVGLSILALRLGTLVPRKKKVKSQCYGEQYNSNVDIACRLAAMNYIDSIPNLWTKEVKI